MNPQGDRQNRNLFFLKSECLDLPEKIYLRRDVILSQEQARAYTQMHKLALAKLDNGELATTASVLTQIMRLQQICCGFLQPDEGDLKVFPNKRLDSLMEIIEETQGKAIIWATYTGLPVIAASEIIEVESHVTMIIFARPSEDK